MAAHDTLDDRCEDPHHGHRTLLPLAVDVSVLERGATLLRAVADPARLRLLAHLERGGACVSELAQAEGEGLSTISQRLRLLHGVHLVARQRRGKHVTYRLADQHVIDLVRIVLAHVTEATRGQQPFSPPPQKDSL